MKRPCVKNSVYLLPLHIAIFYIVFSATVYSLFGVFHALVTLPGYSSFYLVFPGAGFPVVARGRRIKDRG